MNEEIWQAIVNCDDSYDGKFYYGVETTGVFCRPSCKSKNPKKENVKIFDSVNQALSSAFRPCKRCRPDQLRWPDEELVHHTVHLIEKHYREPLTLAILADLIPISPFHLHRTFKRVTGLTPADFILQKRMDTAKQLLSQSNSTITDISLKVGFQNAAHFSTLFQKQTGLTPTEFRNQFNINQKVIH